MSLLATLKEHIEEDNPIDQLLVEQTVDFFKDEHISRYYQLIKPIDLTDDRAKVVKCWLALFSGDNLTLSLLSKHVNPEHLDQAFLGFFTDLKSLAGVFGHPKDRLKQSDRAIELLKETDSFFLANAYLTRGQLYRGFEQFRDAATYFEKAYELFLKKACVFPAVLSLTNALLNRFHLGEFDAIFETTSQARLVGSVQNGVVVDYWDLLSLPEGMALIQKRQYKAGLYHLKKAYKMIESFNLIHMHGYVEIYLLTGYHMTHQTMMFDKVQANTLALFKNMKYPMMQAILIYADVLKGKTISEEHIETLMVSMNTKQAMIDPLQFELATYFYVFEQTSDFSLKQIETQIEQYRFKGDLVSLAQMLLFLAEYYYKEKDKAACQSACEEYLELYHQLDMTLPLFKYHYHFIDVIKHLDDRIEIVQPLPVELTEKEKEILMDIEEGLSNKDIAQKQFITVGTVKWHTNNIYSKLNVKGRYEAVKQAKKLNII